MKFFDKKIKNQSGFTFLELLISVSIFAMLSVAIAGIYVAFERGQFRTKASQTLLNHSQYAMEVISREIRNSKIINYNPDDTWCNDMITGTNDTYTYKDCIFLERDDGQTVAIAILDYPSADYLKHILISCDDDYTSCDNSWMSNARSNVTLLSPSINNIAVVGLDFDITPSSDPYELGGPNVQPRVTIQLHTKYWSYDSPDAFRPEQTLQTTVSSRVYGR